MSQIEPEVEGSGPASLKPWHKRRLVFVLVLSVCLHLVYLNSIPRVYSDEGLQARILHDLVSGRMQVESITWTGFSAFHPYPLLFYVVTAPLFLILKSVLAARIVTAAAGVLSTWLVFAVGRRMTDARTGLWSALFFTLMPFETLFARWGFVHALAMVFVVWAFYQCVVYRQEKRRRSAVWAGLAAGLATVTVYWAGPIAVLVFVFLVFLNRRDALIALAVSAAPLLAQVAVMTLVHGAPAIFYDIASLARIFAGELGSGPKAGTFFQIFGGYATLFGIRKVGFVTLAQIRDVLTDFLILGGYHLAGLVGIFFAPVGWRRRWLLASFLGMSVLVVATRGSRIGMFYYPALLFLPFLMIGFGMLASAAMGRMERLCRELGRAPGFFMALVTLPFLLFLVPSVNVHRALLSGRFDLTSAMGTQFSVPNTLALNDAVKFANERVQPEDLVVTTPLVAYKIDCHVASVRQLVAYAGKASDQYPHDIPHDRFTVALEPENVAYLVTDPYFRAHSMTLWNVFPMVLEMEKNGWPLVYWNPWYMVYAGPKARGEDEVQDSDPLIVNNPLQYEMWAKSRRQAMDWEGCRWAYRRAARSLSEGLDYMEDERRTPEMYQTLRGFYRKVEALEKHFEDLEAAAEAAKRSVEAKKEYLRRKKDLEQKMMEQAGQLGTGR